jgi:hypothetical protein
MAVRGLPGALHALKSVPGSPAARVKQPYRRRSGEFSKPHSINPLSDYHLGVLAIAAYAAVHLVAAESGCL